MNGLHRGAAAASDASVPEHSRSADRAADASAGVGTGADSIWLPQAAGAAASRWLASGQKVGLPSVPRGEAGIAEAAEGTETGLGAQSAEAAGGTAESLQAYSAPVLCS